MVNTQTLTPVNAYEDVEQQELSFTAGGTATLEESLEVLAKLNRVSLHNPGIVLLGIYPSEFKTYIHPKTCTGMFIAGLLISAPNCKQPHDLQEADE